ncbi:MAG: homoserine dehydrogenase [Gemmatimonadaceae bacterium]
MENQNIAIIGLGRIGSAFLSEMINKNDKGINLDYASEKMDTPGRAQALSAGVKVVTLDEIVQLGRKIDIIFDLTGNAEVRKELRRKMSATGNQHTVIASESIARLIWSLLSAESPPVIEGRITGY